MTSRLGKSLVAILLIFSIGGHWALLQSVAWVTMVVDFSKTAPIAEAVSKTFDGQHPCKLCKIVKKGQEKEQKQEAIKVKTKLDLSMPADAIAAPALDLAYSAPIHFVEAFHLRFETPAVPPPRFS